eukprot:TRINITY_DN40296_c0_g1_i1.p1 TRINITY_DN40296_c0_g1~~TRINITY_DN40296_c0_g1_i1.p1  ORF type:complete len:902 (-),score=124.95 TRINITY_DN40296_c0_g1_i1:5229-7934(-)
MAKPQARASHMVLSTGSVSSEVTHLFRTKRVSEIRAFEAQVRSYADEKSSALRELLGTRYKDILNAADEMISMRNASVTRVRDALRDLTSSTQELEKYFISKGNEDKSETNNDDLERRRSVHVVGSRLKHIVDSPEALYANIESGEIYEAAVRYSLAFENYNQVTSTSGLEGVANRFAELQWKQVKGFKDQILEAAEKKLQEAGHTSLEYARVFVSLMLLSDNCDVVAILDGMLASRTGLIWNEGQGQQYPEVHLQMKRIASIVRETITCVSDMFWGENGVETLLLGVNDQAIKEVSRLKSERVLNSACTAWTRNVKGWLEERGSVILASADTSRELADTLRAIDDAFDYDQWEGDCRQALLESPNFVFAIFKPFIRDRAGVVARECIERTVNKVLEDINGAWGVIETRAHAGKRIWAVISGKPIGTSIITDETSSQSSQRSESIAIAKILSSNGQVSEVLGTFDKSVREAVSDVQVLTKRIPAVSEDFVGSVRSSLPRILSNLKQRLDSIPVEGTNDGSRADEPSDYHLGCALFVAWLSTAFSNAEGVRRAYYFTERVESNKEELQDYQDFQRRAEQLSSAAYNIWARRLVLQLGEKLLSELTVAKNLEVKMGWSSNIVSNKLKEEHGNEEPVQYPTTASIPLINFLLAVNIATGHAGGFALPQEAINHIRKEIVNTSIRCYKAALSAYFGKGKTAGRVHDILERESEEKRNAAVMQLLFDMRAVRHMFSSVGKEARSVTDEEKELERLEHSFQSMLELNSLSNWREPFQEAVRSYASRTCVLLGLVGQCSPEERLPVKKPHTATSVNASSNLVALAKTVPRFTYLPAPMPSTYSITVGAPSGLNTKTMGMLRSQLSSTTTPAHRKRDPESSVADYASKVTESVGRFGRGFFESFTRKVT